MNGGGTEALCHMSSEFIRGLPASLKALLVHHGAHHGPGVVVGKIALEPQGGLFSAPTV